MGIRRQAGAVSDCISLGRTPEPQLPQLSNGGRLRFCSALTFWAPTLHEERRIVEREKQEEEADRIWSDAGSLM